MSAEMAKTHVSASDAQQCKILLETQQKERDDYKRNCRRIHDRVMVLLPQTAVDKLEARSDWHDINQIADILRLRPAVLAAVMNSNVRLYTAVQAARSSRLAICPRICKGESLYTHFERAQTAFDAHDLGGFGWRVDAHYAEKVAARLVDPDHDRSLWLRGEPPQAEAAKIRRACVTAFQAVVLI